MSNGPVSLIRAEETRALFDFWRGQRLREMGPLLKPGGKYEMATRESREGARSMPPCRTALPKRWCGLTKRLVILPRSNDIWVGMTKLTPYGAKKAT